MTDGDFEFPAAPLSPSLPSDFLDPPGPATQANGQASSCDGLKITRSSPTRSPKVSPRRSPRSGADSIGSEVLDSEPLKLDNSKLETSKPASKSNPKPASRQSSRTEPLTPDEERRCRECSKKMAQWVDKARSKKHDSDRARSDRKHRLSCVLALDAVICFMIGFDYDDRQEAIRSNAAPGTLHARSWTTLTPYLAKLAIAAESVDTDLAGVYYQICAVVRLHVAYLQRRTTTPEDSARSLYAALADFRRGLGLLPLYTLHSRYQMNGASGWMETKVNPDRPDPLANTATLPLHVNSSLAEAAAFALHVGRKWAEIEGIGYTWESSKP